MVKQRQGNMLKQQVGQYNMVWDLNAAGAMNYLVINLEPQVDNHLLVDEKLINNGCNP